MMKIKTLLLLGFLTVYPYVVSYLDGKDVVFVTNSAYFSYTMGSESGKIYNGLILRNASSVTVYCQ